MLALIQVEAERDAVVEQIRFDERQRITTGILAVGHRRLGVQTSTKEVTFGNADFRERTVRRRVTARYREVAGGFFFEVDDQNHTVAGGAGLGDDLHVFEEVEVLQSPFGAIDQRAVIGVAFGKIEFTANHIVAGAGVAADIDALDIGSRTFIHGESDRNGVLLEIAVTARANHREGITAPRGLDLHFFDGFFQRFGVVEPTDADARVAAQHVGIEG